MWQIDRRILTHFDLGLFFTTILIPLMGLVVLYSAGYDPDTANLTFSIFPRPFKSTVCVKQSIFIAFGFAAMIAGMSFSTRFLKQWAYPLYGLCLLMLLLVLIPSIGSASHGARRWFVAGDLYFQPAEAMKIGLIIAMARHLSKKKDMWGKLGFKQLIFPFVLAVVPMFLIVQQPDLGTALSVGVIGFMMIMFVGVNPRTLLITTASLLVLAVPAWTSVLRPYQRRRIMSLIYPEASPLESGYHLAQSKIAVGSGELFGKGFLKGTQTQLGFLPEHTTDFIFSVLAEEWGFAGSMVVLLLYMLLIFLILRVGYRCKSMFGALVCVGVAGLIFFHTVVNIGMVLGLMPVVGITLPLFSYGGSSMVTFMFAIGVVLGIGMRRFLFTGGKV